MPNNHVELTVEDALLRIEESAAMLRYMADAVGLNSALPDVKVMNGVADVCEQVQELARHVRTALDVHALAVPLIRKRPGKRRAPGTR